MWTLILIVTLYQSSLHTQHIEGFTNEPACLKALEQVKVSVRGQVPSDNLKVTGTCVKVGL